MNIWRGKKTRPWDGRRIDLGQLEGPVLLCTGRGRVLEATSAGRALAARAGLLPAGASGLPDELWQRLRRRPGEVVRLPGEAGPHLGATLTPLGEDHAMVYLLKLEPERLEQLLQGMQDQQQEAMTRISACLAHDLRAPMATVIFDVEVLRERWSSLPTGEVECLLEEIGASCRAQERSILGLIEAARLRPREVVQLDALLRRVERYISQAYQAQAPRLRVDVGEHRVLGAPLALEHAFVNLVTNAVQAARGQAEVTITASHVEPSSTWEGTSAAPAWIAVLVQDDGPGVPPQARPLIFDPFFTTRAAGNGVGLTLTRRSVREMGGEVSLVPSGSGACFEVKLIAADQEDPEGVQWRGP